MVEVSVIVPIYNGQNYIKSLLDELHSQSFTNVEFILVNDGSTDKTRVLINEYLNFTNDSRFHLFNKKNEGVSSARNCGLKHASGYYVIFVDSDDKFDKEFVYKYYSRIHSNGTDLEIFRAKIIDDENDNIGLVNKEIFRNEYISSQRFLEYYSDFKIETYPFTYISKRRFWSDHSFSTAVSYQEDTLALISMILNFSDLRIHLNTDYYYYYEVRSESTLRNLSLHQYWDAVSVNEYLAEKIKKEDLLSTTYNKFLSHKASSLMDIIILSIFQQNFDNYYRARMKFLQEFKFFKFSKTNNIKRYIQFVLVKFNMKRVLKFIYKLRG